MPDHGKGGRPPLGENAKKAQIPIRVSERFATLIREAAARNGKSLSQEIEDRLVASFVREIIL